MPDMTKQRIINYLFQQTKQLDWEQLSDFTAVAIAKHFELSRTLVSQYLNEAVTEGLVVKVKSRPVYFFSAAALIGGASQDMPEGIYDSVAFLKEELNEHNEKSSAFDKMIGAAGSLSYNIEQCKAAISYPGNGLPILILGPTGCGKSYLASLMYEYALEKGIIKMDKQFVNVNCAEYANNPELFLTNLLGFKKGAYTGADRDRKGLISLADGGVIFLDEIHCLSYECQEKLFHFMDKGVYHMIGDNERWYSANTHMIMATTEDPNKALLKTLVRRIPIITSISALSERPVREKKELLFYLLKKEADEIGKKIRISSWAYQALVNYRFDENVGLLVNCIRASTANVFQESMNKESEYMDIHIHHLPDYILKSTVIRSGNLEEENLMDTNDIRRELQTEKKLFTFNRDIVRQFKRIIDEGGNTEDFFGISQTRYLKYLEDVYQENGTEKNPKNSLYTEMIKDICSSTGKRLGVEFYDHDIQNLNSLMCDYIFNGASCAALERKNYETIQIALEVFIKGATIRNNQMQQELVKAISAHIGKELSLLGLLDLYICLSAFSLQIEPKQALGVIMTRGEGSAKVLAAAANHLLGYPLYGALDIPIEITGELVMKRVFEYMEALGETRDVILLTDLEEVTPLQEHMVQMGNRDLGIIGNVSMGIVIDIGKQLLKEHTVEMLFDKKEGFSTKHDAVYVKNRKKAAAILTVCKTGMGTARRISELLSTSLPEEVALPVIAYDYRSLAKAKLLAPVFEKYSVLFIVGTDDPKVKGIPFIYLEDIIQQHNTGRINELLARVMRNDQLLGFNQNLVKKFSLTNLVEHLTVLNPEKIINFAEDIVKKLQSRTGIALKNSLIVGLYIHICCMIERLMTDKQTVYYDESEEFEKRNQDFIKMVKECFEAVESYYGVTIPVPEIGYLYEYIHNL